MPDGSIYDIPVTSLDGTPGTLDPYRGQVMLIVNVASKCGFTPQYAGLEALYRTYKDRGFVVLGFPCNQFLGQEPGGSGDIAAFCSVNFGVSFPLFEKVTVNGSGTHPLYRHIKAARRGFLGTKAIKWNFTKFLVGRDGEVVERFGTSTKPEALAGAIEKLLG